MEPHGIWNLSGKGWEDKDGIWNQSEKGWEDKDLIWNQSEKGWEDKDGIGSNQTRAAGRIRINNGIWNPYKFQLFERRTIVG